MYNVTIFKYIRNPKPSSIVSLDEILQGIADGKWKDAVSKCYINLSNKERLLCFLPTGEYTHRSISGLIHYNGIICLDIDNVIDVIALKEKCKSLDWIYSAFITPSGKGLKVIVKTNSTVETYKDIELKVATDFFNATGQLRDNHAKDISRLQFVSYDPKIYINPNSKIYGTV